MVQWSAAQSRCANWHHNGPLIMAITQRTSALWRLQAAGNASVRYGPLQWTPPLWHPALTIGVLLGLLYYFSILNRRCLLILCANTLNGNFVQGDQHPASKGANASPSSFCYPQNTHHSRGTHAKCWHLHSERIFHVTFAKAKQTFTQAIPTIECLKGLLATAFARRTACHVVLLFDLYSVLIAHLPLCVCVCVFFCRGEILASICSKKMDFKLCVLFCFPFKCFINKNPGAFCSIVPYTHTHKPMKRFRERNVYFENCCDSVSSFSNFLLLYAKP